jgi:hypothetical protein
MAFLVLFSTVSFTVEKHFCGDTLIDVAVFSKAENCEVDQYMSLIEKKHCCKDELELVKGQDNLKLSKSEDYQLQHQVFITNFAYLYLDLFESVDKEIIPFKNYSPPNLVVDILIMDQVFII